MAYDPVVEGMDTAVRAPAPTYVDDLAALLRGARQTLRSTLFLVFGSWAAGLEVTPHHCAALRMGDTPAVRAACLDLPVRVTVRVEGQVDVSGLPTALLRALLASRLGSCMDGVQHVALPCRFSP